MNKFIIDIEYCTPDDLIISLVNAFKKEINKKETESQSKLPTVDYFINRLCAKYGYSVPAMKMFIADLSTMSMASTINLLLREIALYFDSKYKDCITNSEDIYVISMLDGRIHKVNKAGIKNYRNFAAFRTLEDAKSACKILREPLKNMFANGKKKKH